MATAVLGTREIPVSLELIAIDGAEFRVGCLVCRAVWRAAAEPVAQCPVCGACASWATLWAAWTGADGTTDYHAPDTSWGDQWHRTAMVVMLVVVVSIWALTLCVRLAEGQTVRLCVPDYDSVTSVTVLNTRRGSVPTEPTPTGATLEQRITVPPTRTPLPVGVCPDMDPNTTGYVDVPITSLTRRGLRNTWTAWSLSSDDVTSDPSNTIMPTPLRQRPARLVP